MMSTILCHAMQQSHGTRASLLCYEEATVCCASLLVLVIKRSIVSLISAPDVQRGLRGLVVCGV